MNGKTHKENPSQSTQQQNPKETQSTKTESSQNKPKQPRKSTKPVKPIKPITKAELEKIVSKQVLEISNQKEINLKLKEANMDLLVEMESLRKRTEREIEKISNFGNENLVKELLPLIDSLELAISHKNTNSEDLKIGIKMSYDMLVKVLEKHKVSFINPAINSPLNPELHEAITIVPNKDIQHNHILDVMQQGVMLSGRVVRSAKVIVAQNSATNLSDK